MNFFKILLFLNFKFFFKLLQQINKYIIHQGFFPGGPPHPAKILPIPPPSDTCPRFWTKACPPPSRGSSPKIWKF